MKGIYYSKLSEFESWDFNNDNVIGEIVAGDTVWIKCQKDVDVPEQPKKEEPAQEESPQESESYYLVGSDELKIKESQVIHIESKNDLVEFEYTRGGPKETKIQDNYYIIRYLSDEGLPCEINTYRLVYCSIRSDSQIPKFRDFMGYWVQTVNDQIDELRPKKEEK